MPIKPGSMGLPLPGFEVKIRHKEGSEVSLGERGIIIAKKNPFFLGKGYWVKPENGRSALPKGISITLGI